MSCVCLIDTGVLLNLLNVPGRNQQVQEVTADYCHYTELGATFILPMATILETGNHIAQNGNGALRRETAVRFCDMVRASFTENNPPWRPSEFPSIQEVTQWLERFPVLAGQNKSPTRIGEGTSFGDLSIIAEYEKCQRRFAMSEVFIWSLDSDLASYHHRP
ncbi:hypothetical protein [Vreelandella salicampi]|uniref:PIN domain-containing protein n=1 Tax=Vreelandella salicampi TaxID=1449798 RepID=A0A7Z0LL77_9GAMM|nr:hypothetical protein [Halomonas salicampi]NYS61050.1 hypothetical protein [Halomonas salicampi]